MNHRADAADGLRAIGTGFRGATLPHFTHPTDHDLSPIARMRLMGYVRWALVFAGRRCRTSPILRTTIVNHRVDAADGLRAVGTCFRGSTLPHFTHPTNHDL